MTELRSALQSALMLALKEHDRVAASACRGALSAIANAEAVPMEETQRAGAIESASVGVGAADVARRALSATEVAAIVTAEAADLERAAHTVSAIDPDRARTLGRQAALLTAVLRDEPAPLTQP